MMKNLNEQIKNAKTKEERDELINHKQNIIETGERVREEHRKEYIDQKEKD